MALPLALVLSAAPPAQVDPVDPAGLQAALGARAHKDAPSAPARTYTGAESTVLDIVRPGPGGPRIFVQATLPDGSMGTFLVDTGADVSVVGSRAAARLGLDNGRQVDVWGLSGTASVGAAVLPELRLGDVIVHDIDVLVGVPGFQDELGFMPVDGLLGNNVWSQFTLEIDYPTDRMTLLPPGSGPSRRRSSPMLFADGHVHTLITVTTAGDDPRRVQVITQVDTGASDLTLCAATGLPFADDYTQGLETVRGIGASETLPPFRFLEMTRRIPIAKVELGGATVDIGLPARWVSYENTRTATCGGAGGMKALLGHEYLAGNKVVFDYAAGRFALLKSKGKPRQLDGHALLFAQEMGRNGEPPERGLIRGKLLLGMGEDQRAVGALQAFLDAEGTDPEERAEAEVLLAQVLRHEGKHEEAWRVLRDLGAGDLVDQDQIVGTVNGLLFEDLPNDARSLAEQAVADRPDNGWSHVALADVLIQDGAYDRAREELLVAADLEQYPDAHLLRRARVALASGDRYGAMAHIRKLLKLYPGGGPYLWFYAMLVQDDADRATFRADVDAAMARLHPYNLPLDFLVAANRALGDARAVETGLAKGLEAHCAPVPESPDRDNCFAWYYALAGVKPDDALARIDRALASTGDRSDFLDTKAMVHLSRGEYDQALTAAYAAARLSPDDVYMLWQAERIAEIAAAQREARGAGPTPGPTAATAEAPNP